MHVTSLSELAVGGDAESPGLLTDTQLGAAGALAVLLFVFASLLSTVPLVIAAVSILTTFLLILGVTYLTDVSFIVQFLVALIGLGIAIDYSLLLVTRWREELANGHQGAEAVHRAMETSGRAVLFSGVTVAIGLVSMVFLPTQHRLCRCADPTGQSRGDADLAAHRPGHHRAPTGLASAAKGDACRPSRSVATAVSP